MNFSGESASSASAELFAVAVSTLEHTITPLTHKTEVRLRAELELLPAPPTNHPGKYIPLVKPGSDWNVTISYVPQLDALGLTRVRVPSEEGTAITHLEIAPSFPDVFLGFHVPAANPNNITPISGIDGEPVAFKKSHIKQITDTLIAPFPVFLPGESPAATQQKLADLRDRALGWHTVDRATKPLSPSTQLTVEKHVLRASGSPDAAMSTSTSEYLTLLVNVIRERVSADGQRSQVVVAFHGNDYFMHEPDITGRILSPSGESPSGYVVSDPYRPAQTDAEKRRLVTSLTNVLLDDLSR